MFQKRIAEAEQRWLPLIRPYLREVFRGIPLPSHGLQHHLRVWANAAGLLENLEPEADYEMVEATLVACMFHDAGLAEEPGPLHGRKSREMCEEFLSRMNIRGSSRQGEMLRAIEKHDAKTAGNGEAFVRGKTPGILAILSVADDLEALGTMGIYRYAEIYLHRGIPLEKLGLMILENAFIRRRNLLRYATALPGLRERILREAEILIRFWSLYNQQLQVAIDPPSCGWGEIGIVNQIATRGPAGAGSGKTLNTFFDDLQKEFRDDRN